MQYNWTNINKSTTIYIIMYGLTLTNPFMLITFVFNYL